MLKGKEKLKIKANSDDVKFINDTVILDVIYNNKLNSVNDVKQNTRIDDVVFWF